MPARATLIAGFLGSGKTTLLNALLRAAHGERIAVLVNDFGAIHLDAELVVSVEDGVVALANGCVCCTLHGDLIAAVQRLLRREPAPDRLVVELSGVSDPAAVVRSFQVMQRSWPIDLDGVVTLVDAESLPRAGSPHRSLALDQIAAADLVVLTKTDLLSRELLAATARELAELLPRIRLVESRRGLVPPELLLGAFSGDAREWRSPGAPGPAAPHSTEFSHASWRSTRPLSLEALRTVATELPSSVIRVKGILHLAELPTHRVELSVVGRRARVARLDPWGDRARESVLVMVGAAGSLPDPSVQAALDAALAPQASAVPGVLERALGWLRRGA